MAIAAVLLSPLLAHAQHWAFQSYGAEAGLTNPTVLAMQQDAQGYLWISTEGGLFRYDGDRFQAFDAYLPGRVGSITSLHLSSDNQLWASASGVVFRWSGSEFLTVPGLNDLELESGQALASDATHLYAASDAGLWSLPLAGGKPRQLTTAPVFSVFVGRDKTVWFGCGTGLCAIRNGREIESKAAPGMPSGPWRSIVEDPGGHLWIRSADMVYVRSADGQFRQMGRFSAIHNSRLVASRSGEILVPHNAGLAICDLKACRNYSLESGLQPSEVIAVEQDREGSLWLGYSGQGLVRWLGREEWQSFNQMEGLTNAQVWRIARDSAGNLWVGTNHGLFRGSEQSGRWHFTRSNVLSDWTVYGLLADPGGSLWLGTFQSGINGLVRYDPRTGKTTVYPPPPASPHLSIGALARDATGTIWVTIGKGVLRLRPGSNHLETVDLPASNGRPYQVLFRDGTRYVASRNGLFVERSGFRRLLTIADGLNSNAIQSLAAGPNGEVWIAYFGPNGISRLDWIGSHLQIRHFTTAEGLPSNTVYSQFFDARGNHWIGTDSGAARLAGSRWIQYDTSSGLVWNDCNTQSFLAEPDGTVWIGTSAGLARFSPAPLAAPPVPSTLVTSFMRNDAVTTGEVFDASTQSIALRFTMLSYREERPLFRYRLGRTSSWIETRAKEVRFAALSPGFYHFEVAGQLSPGVWSSPASRDFSIRPPWYRGTPFLALASSLVLALVWFGWRTREAHQQKLRAALELAVEERTRSLAAATARAEEESRCKSQFLANMSHEMRTPLNGVLGLTKLALDLSNEPQVVNHLATVQFSAKLLLSLINDVLDLAKMEAGRLEISPVAFSPRMFFEEVRAMMASEAQAKGLSLKLLTEPTVPAWIMADDCRLRQVVVNLVGNAIKFTQQGGVTVRVWYQEKQLQCAVTDTGIGIDKPQHHKIFDIFQQADSSTSRRHGGTGLGLAISLKLVTSMGGSIQLESELGCGSTFSFDISAPETTAPAIQSDSSQEAPVRPMRILVAEDNKVNQHLLTALLRKRGHTSLVAQNGREALAACSQESFDLVLMDIQMPDMDGIEAVGLIRQSEMTLGRRTPVVAVTARAMPNDRDQILEAGMDDYLDKPIQTERLDAILRRFAPSPVPDTSPAVQVPACAEPDKELSTC